MGEPEGNVAPYMVYLENLSKLVKRLVELKHDWKACEIRRLVLPHLVEWSQVKPPLFGHEEVWSCSWSGFCKSFEWCFVSVCMISGGPE